MATLVEDDEVDSEFEIGLEAELVHDHVVSNPEQNLMDKNDDPQSSSDHGEYAEEQFDSLWWLHLEAAVLHFTQALFQTILIATKHNFYNFKLPIRQFYLTRIDGYLDTTSKTLFDCHVGWTVILYSFSTAAGHFLICTPWYNRIYRTQINNGCNYLRWIEYATTSSLMIFTVTLLFGIFDIAFQLYVVFMNIIMNCCGAMMERYNRIRTPDYKIDWLPFIIGAFAGSMPWIAIFFYLSGSIESIPGFTWSVFFGFVILWCTFPLNMVLQYKRVGAWKDYIYGEQAYMLLSFTSKTLLGWLMFGGMNQRSAYAS